MNFTVPSVSIYAAHVGSLRGSNRTPMRFVVCSIFFFVRFVIVAPIILARCGKETGFVIDRVGIINLIDSEVQHL